MRVLTGFMWLGTQANGRVLWTDNEPSGSIKCGGYLAEKVLTFQEGL
jgi:hypothetical protein